MSTKASPPTRTEHGADPWWGDTPELGTPSVASSAAAPVAASRTRSRSRRAARRNRTGMGWVLLGLLLAPWRALGRWLITNPVTRKLLVRGAIVATIVAFLACSVGVILINNVVIGRTAELGELDDRRRELRRDNALLGAQAARLSVSPVVVRRATRDLGMVQNPKMPKFVYLDSNHRTLTPGQRRRIIKRNQERLERAAERERAASGGAE